MSVEQPFPDDANEPGLVGNEPSLEYNFLGYFYYGNDDELGLGVYIKDTADGEERNLSDVSGLMEEFSSNLTADMYAIERITPYEQVSADERREASAYLTLAEAFERGSRIKGVNWGIYELNDGYHLWVARTTE